MRVKALDIAKGIGIILMVIGHVTARGKLINDIICQFHMPLFLLISGFLFNDKKWHDTGAFLCSRVRVLLVPYCFFAVILLLYWCLLQGNDFFFLIRTNIPGAIWFIIVLFFVELIFQLLSKKITNVYILVFLAFLFFSMAKLLDYYDFELPYRLSSIPVCLSFYTLGFVLKNSPPPIKNTNHSPDNLLVPAYRSSIIFTVGIVCLLLVSVNGLINGTETDLSGNHISWFGFFPAMIGSYGIMCFSVLIERFCKHASAILCWFGQNTLSFIGLNMLIIGLNSMFVRPLVDNVLLYKVIEFITTIAVCALVSYLLNRYLSWVLGKRKQARPCYN